MRYAGLTLKIVLISAFATGFYLLVASLAGPGSTEFTYQSDRIPYDLLHPDAIWKTEVPEISGICLYNDQLAAIQDEWARIDLLSLQDGSKQGEVRFGKAGDFEDIIYFDEHFVLLRSDGKLYQVDPKTGDRRGIDTDISAKANPEGMWYNPSDSSIWIASKHRGGNNARNDRTIYRAKWKPKKDELNFKKAFELKGDFIRAGYQKELLSDIEKKRSTNGTLFQPAAIGQNPLTGDLWIISGDPPGLMISDFDGANAQMIGMPSNLWPQPEGIQFLEDGTLLIASEITNAVYVYHPKTD